jgi:polar amino acid transport system substrate-binding protein
VHGSKEKLRWRQRLRAHLLDILRPFPVLLLLMTTGCGHSSLPRDPEKTLERVRGGELRVGLVEHPPWVIRTSGEPAGAEVALVRELAQEQNAKPQWHWGGEQQHLEALERYELDLVIGGLTKETPWSKTIGLTTSYYDNRIVIGVPRAVTPPPSIKGMHVVARRGQVFAAYAERKGAAVMRVDDLKTANAPVAAPEWEIEQLGLVATGIELLTEKHVMAAPPGENGWIKQIDDFLHARRDNVKQLLQRESTRQ